MRWRSAAGLVLTSLLLLSTGGPVSFAQNEDGSRFFQPPGDRRAVVGDVFSEEG